jgi:hypothetical protein
MHSTRQQPVQQQSMPDSSQYYDYNEADSGGGGVAINDGFDDADLQ